MELKVFPAPAVAGVMKTMVEARMHNDGSNQDEVRAWQDSMIHTGATPSYALIDPASGDLIALHAGPDLDPDSFSAWLREAREAWEAR